jgi:hypothetical protein
MDAADSQAQHPTTTPSPQRPSRTPLFEAYNNRRYARQELIREIEQRTRRPLICFVGGSHTEITRNDPLYFVDLLHNLRQGADIDFLLHTGGGDIDAAEKLGLLLRKKAAPNGSIRVIVPDYAKSAGTLLALAGDQILMSDSSELGTIDPQISRPDGEGYSAKTYLDAYDRHSDRLAKKPDDAVAKIALEKLDPVLVRKYERMTSRASAIAVDLLREGMIPDEQEAMKVATTLLDTNKWLSHGQMITHERALGVVGLRIEYLPPRDELWDLFWRLYCQQRIAAGEDQKLFESGIASLGED